MAMQSRDLRGQRGRGRLRHLLWWTAAMVVLAAVAVALRAGYAFRDRSPGYWLDLTVVPSTGPEPRKFRVGFGRVKITPDLQGNRPVYLAGFGQNRVALGVHDDLWAVACVMEDGDRRVALVVLDAIGLFHDEVVRVRQAVPTAWDLDYVVLCSTHNHSAPDLMGLWGPRLWRSGVDPAYLARVREAGVAALGQAVAGLTPARMVSFTVTCSPEGLLTDTRPPVVYDADLQVVLFVAADSDQILGSIVNWGNHPETPWSGNRQITADYCGFLREALERGVQVEGREVLAPVGGVHVFVNGAVGGLMTTSPGVTVEEPWTGRKLREPSHEKSRALGHVLAARLAPVMRQMASSAGPEVSVSVWARTIEVPVRNWRYWLAGWLGVLDRGYVRWPRVRSEVALIGVGDAAMVCVPGELYPEIANGGVESPAGADYPGEPLEVPPLRQLMPGRVKLVLGLANDELGYLIPKTQWDEKPPYTYGRGRPPYGEVNSCGPETAAVVYRALADLCRRAGAVLGGGEGPSS